MTTTDAFRSCRLCDENSEQMYNIFEANEFNTKLIKLIRDCLPIVIYEDDPLSKLICNSCIENLNQFSDFKRTCTDIARKHKLELQQSAATTQNAAIDSYLSKMKEFPEMDDLNNETPEAPVTDSNSMTDMDSMDEVSQNGEVEEKTCASDECASLIQHKPRISGPKSKTNSYTRIISSNKVVYQPLALLELVVQSINAENIEDFSLNYSTEHVIANETLYYCCRYCEESFEDETLLAVHELQTHIKLHLRKVDAGPRWNKLKDGFAIRNKWLQINDLSDTEEDISVGTDEQLMKDLLVPLDEDSIKEEEKKVPPLDVSRNSEVYFVDDKPYAKGMPLKNVPKEVRNTFYQSVLMSGLRRKFCQLCRYTFKDNWSIDNHYFQNNCRFTCHFCGAKFKRSRHEFPAHLAEHKAAGHKKSLNVFATNERGSILEYDTSCLTAYVPQISYVYTRPKAPPPAPTAMRLRVRQSLTPPAPFNAASSTKPASPAVSADTSNGSKLGVSDELVKNKAYFCKKCYQVFTKLGNYNTHISTCNGEIDDPEMSLIRHYNKKDGSSPVFCSKVNYRRSAGATTTTMPTKKMPALTPLPLPVVKIKQEHNAISRAPPPPPPPPSPLDFPCNFCSAVFRTVYSRNSHMRIHVKNKQPVVQARTAAGGGVKRASSPPPDYHPAKRIKTENNFEPIVEIHEGATTTIGSVSITPLRKPTTSGAVVSADVMKLVQNNPNISFRPRAATTKHSPPMSGEQRLSRHQLGAATRSSQANDEAVPDPNKGYKCASCFQYYSNKSTLYFHKKNQCTGSRFPCPFCKKRFGTAGEYSSHIFYSHPE